MVGGVELMLIAMMLLLLFGPKRLGEFGRALGEAMREYSKAKNRGYEDPEPPVRTSTGPDIPAMGERPEWLERDERLRAVALQLELDIHDKTPEELQTLIMDRLG